MGANLEYKLHVEALKMGNSIGMIEIICIFISIEIAQERKTVWERKKEYEKNGDRKGYRERREKSVARLPEIKNRNRNIIFNL